MKYNIRIVLTGVKACYSVAFLLILALIRGVSYREEIGAAMDANVALLAIIFCADTYYREVQDNHWEVFNLLPDKNRFHTITQRLLIQIIYISILLSLDYWVFYLKTISYETQTNWMLSYITAIFACSASVLFFGTLAYTLVNVIKNLWAGIGSTFLIWITLNSTVGKNIPMYINVFGYGSNQDMEISKDWIIGKLVAIFISIILIYINRRLLVWKRKG